MYEILKNLVIVLGALCGVFMAVKPELALKKEWREKPGKLMLGRILGVLIALACIGLVIMNLK
ncbi:MAG: hypothetical protein HFJ09_10355 [Lachnospiraceae bacterium]|nr:hypothetical protein [Lachnospiraceae bacterium]